MKYAREIKVGILFIVCLFLLFFGFNFLKGKNIFSPSNAYHGTFENLHGLQEQSPVLIAGYKVGLVSNITYDYTRDSAFVVEVSIDDDICLPEGTQMALVADGLLGGMAIELQIPRDSAGHILSTQVIAHGSALPTCFQGGLLDGLQDQLLSKVGAAIESADSLLQTIQSQLADGHLQQSLEHVDMLTADLSVVSAELKKLSRNQLPGIVNNVDSVMNDVQSITSQISQTDLTAIVGRVDSALANVNGVVSDIRNPQGTVGKLLYDEQLYNHLDATVQSADSLLTDLKAHPKRYVHFSLFGKKDK